MFCRIPGSLVPSILLSRRHDPLTRLFDSETAEADIVVANLHFATTTSTPATITTTTSETKSSYTSEGMDGSRTNGTILQDNNDHDVAVMDTPMPTANGGYTHTTLSKAKISAANKGKTPWNKGKERSPQVKASIAAGVRASNRARLLQKLKDMGMTEEQYETQKELERQAKQNESKARRTENGGYRPTEETRQKISDILKAKWANGEIKRGQVDPAKVRRGFSHSDETKAKIRESLKKKWADDPEYRDNQVNQSLANNGAISTKEKISETLKAKWQDPEFREKMMEKMKNRKKPETGVRNETYRNKVSEAMKARWQDPEFRTKALSAIRARSQEAANRRPTAAVPRLVKPRESKPKRSTAATTTTDNVVKLEPILAPKQKAKKKKAPPRQSNDEAVLKRKTVGRVKGAKPETSNSSSGGTTGSSEVVAVPVVSVQNEPDGSINRLREERRDLFDLLYGDDPEDDKTEDSQVAISPLQSDKFGLDDGDLDDFDPYGLDDH